MNNESPALPYQNLQESFSRISGRIQRFRSLINSNHGIHEIPDFIVREITELESDLQFFAKTIGLDIDMEAKNIREIESVLAQFIANKYVASTEQAELLAKHLMTSGASQAQSISATGGASNALILKAIVAVEVKYKRIDKSLWLRTIDIWYLSDSKPVRYSSESTIPRDELPPAVREQSFSTGQRELHVRIFPQE